MLGDKFTLLKKLLKAIGLPDERVEELVSWIQNWLQDDADEKAGKIQYPYHLKDSYLSPAEVSFYHVLRQVVGKKAVIFPQVSLDNLFYAQTGDYAENRRYRNRIDRKHVDFVLCDPETLRPIAAIELDDKSHRRKDRQRRDRFVNGVFDAAGLPLIRVRTSYNYSPQEVAQLLRDATGGGPTRDAPTEKSSAPPVCPDCGEEMKLRRAKSGRLAGNRFWGCVNYPRCRKILIYEPA